MHVCGPHAPHDAADLTVRIIHGAQQHPLGLCKTPIQRAAGVVPPQLFYLYSHYICSFSSFQILSTAVPPQLNAFQIRINSSNIPRSIIHSLQKYFC
jgi:hypothetical protein